MLSTTQKSERTDWNKNPCLKILKSFVKIKKSARDMIPLLSPKKWEIQRKVFARRRHKLIAPPSHWLSRLLMQRTHTATPDEVHWSTLRYTQVHWVILRYTEVHWGILRYAAGTLKYTEVYSGTLQVHLSKWHIEVYRSTLGHTWSTLRYTWAKDWKMFDMQCKPGVQQRL